MDDGVIPATWHEIIRNRERRENGSGPKWAVLSNAYTERGKIRYGIERGIPLNIPSFLWPERRQWLLEMEQECRAAGHGILARYCREEIERHDARNTRTAAAQSNHG